MRKKIYTILIISMMASIGFFSFISPPLKADPTEDYEIESSSPDLIISKIWVWTWVTWDHWVAYARTKNIGDSSASSSHTRLWLEVTAARGERSSIIYLTVWEIEPLSPGQSQLKMYPFYYDNPEGKKWRACAMADCYDEIQESNENNNVLCTNWKY